MPDSTATSTSNDSQRARGTEPPPSYADSTTSNSRPSTAESSNPPSSMLDVAPPPPRRRSMLDVAEPPSLSASSPPASTAPASSLPPPPDYTALNTTNTNFRILGTFICAAVTSGEARYQLSTTLDHDMRELRIRRLTASESRRIITDPLRPMKFENERTLYTLYMDRWNNAIRLVGVAGEVRIDYSFGRWRVYVLREDRRREMLYWVRRGRVGLDWEDEEGRVVAVETREGDGFSPPLLKLNGEMDERSRDLLVACWVARIWYWSPVAPAPEVSLKERKENVRNRLKLGGEIAGSMPVGRWV